MLFACLLQSKARPLQDHAYLSSLSSGRVFSSTLKRCFASECKLSHERGTTAEEGARIRPRKTVDLQDSLSRRERFKGAHYIEHKRAKFAVKASQ